MNLSSNQRDELYGASINAFSSMLFVKHLSYDLACFFAHETEVNEEDLERFKKQVALSKDMLNSYCEKCSQQLDELVCRVEGLFKEAGHVIGEKTEA